MPNKDKLLKYIALLKEETRKHYRGMLREPGGSFRFPFLTPGSEQYADVLWDWDSWLSNVALRQILVDSEESEKDRVKAYERGCILNSLSWGEMDGWIPIYVGRNTNVAEIKPPDIYIQNMHKPTLAQHAAFLTQIDDNVEWLREGFYNLQSFINNYRNHHRHPPTGLYFWQNDLAIGVDNDPCTFYRPPKSSGSIFLNCLMYRELLAMACLADKLGMDEIGRYYKNDAQDLKEAILEHCWDERDGFFYSVDLNLMPVDHSAWLHRGQPRDWDCLIQRIGVWSGFLALWAEVATQEQAQRVVKHYEDTRTFNSPFGIRTLSRMEKMYNLRATGNPSNWLGAIWGVSNYLVFRGLLKYRYDRQASELTEKTIHLFGRDLERFGALHEYYQPENGEPILNRGFQNWNYLVMNMIAWHEGKIVVAEY